MTVRGELDIATAGHLKSVLCPLLAGGRPVVLDLAGVSFIDSSGLATLMAAVRAADADGGELAIRAASASVLRVIEVSGLGPELHMITGARSGTDGR